VSGFVLDKPDDIEAYRLLVILHRMRMEDKGLRFQISTYAAARRQLGMPPRTPRKKVLSAWEAMLTEMGIKFS